ncbi:MAG: hypothetical protein ACLP19_21025 [Xanthobacteraceae bacterium]
MVYTSCQIGYTYQNGACAFTGCPDGYTLEGTQCLLIGPTALAGEITAVPSIVRQGGQAAIQWSATGVSSCTVSARNGDRWSCAGNACNTPNTEVSSPIAAQTTYTLSCTGNDGSTLTHTATVNIVPSFQEL